MLKKLFFASALMISAAFAFVACSSDDDNNDNKSSLAKTSWTLEVDNPENPMVISIVSDSEGYFTSSYVIEDEDGKVYKDETRTKFTYQKEGEKYKMFIKSVASKDGDTWNIVDYDDVDYTLCFTVNEQAKTMTLTFVNDKIVTVKQTDYTPISWPESSGGGERVVPKTNDDLLGKWRGEAPTPFGFVEFCSFTFKKEGDKYLVDGHVEFVDMLFTRSPFYELNFQNAPYTVYNGLAVIENVADKTNIVLLAINMDCFEASVVLEGKFLAGIPLITKRMSKRK